MSNHAHLVLVSQDASRDSGCADGEIVLSLRDGEVWASWPDARPPVQLGQHDSVVHMMRNFIRQSEVAEKLSRYARSGGIAN
jgi:hypothetical protein